MAENIYEIAQKYGADPLSDLVKMPQGIKAPWEGLSLTNQNSMREYELKQGAKRLEKMGEIISEYKQPLDDMYRFIELNKELTIPSGVLSKPIPDFINSTRNQMGQITSRLAPGMRPIGAGSTSDKDMALYIKSTVGTGNSLEANTNIVAGYQKKADRAIAKQNFFDRYLSVNKTLMGADTAWAKNEDAVMKIMYGPKGTNAYFYDEEQREIPNIIKRNLNRKNN